jgi:NADPH-dependent 2,4-dienoyl-CoA reductase/sulfur reductase-like enzyme/rhodanese-related sulfurtransferase
MVDKDDLISYGGCGIPYFVAGDVSDASELRETSFHMVRDARFFHEVKDIEVLTHTEALSIDRTAKRVHIKNLATQEESTLPYDKLVLATGSRPRRLDFPGIDLDGVFTVNNLNAAIAIKDRIATGKVEKALVIGGGFIGLEMAEALTDLWGIETTIVEITNQLLPGLVSRNMAQIIKHHMEEKEISFLIGESVVRLEGNGTVERAVTTRGSFETDLVIVGAGTLPNSDLAREAGLEVSPKGTIVVNTRMQTSDPDIYAGGDCVQVTNLVTGKPGYYPLGSMANRQGRVIGTNLAGGNAEFPGAVGSFVVKVFDLSVAATGLSIDVARREGFDALSVVIVQFDRAHFYPIKNLMTLELVVDKTSGRVLGIQGIGPMGDATVGRINAVAAMLKYHPTVEDISNLELAYSPPFTAAMDVLNALGNTADNTLAGKNRVLDVDEFDELWKQRDKGDVLFLDCRAPADADPFAKKYPEHWKSIPQDELRARMAEVPRDKKLVLICNTGVRSYEAQVALDQVGISDTCNLQGGVACLKEWGLDLA